MEVGVVVLVFGVVGVFGVCFNVGFFIVFCVVGERGMLVVLVV